MPALESLTTVCDASLAALPPSATQFGYDATESKNKRQPATGILRSEDAELQTAPRRKLISAGRDIQRNFAVASWMIRKHLDYVTTFAFQARMADPAKNKQLEAFMKRYSKPDNCDAAGRHGLARMIRLLEARRTVDGDVLLVRLANGRLQALEGDRVRTPEGGTVEGVDPNKLIHGVQTDAAGRALAYAVCRRGLTSLTSPESATGFVFERMVPRQNAYLHAYFDRFDQVRGISPLAPALNTLRDTYEGFDYALAKMKVSQLFGLVFYRDLYDDNENVTATSGDGTGYEVDFGKGPVKLDLDAGDRAEFLESKTPSTEFQQFSQTMIGVSLKALDIPYSFYAENFTNYSGARQALLQYELSAASKRADNIDLLDWLTEWRVALAIADGELPGIDPVDVRFEWVPKGTSWIDPLKEVQADIAAIGAGLSTRTRVLREQGLDASDIFAELAAEQKQLTDLGLPTSLVVANASLPELEDNAKPV